MKRLLPLFSIAATLSMCGFGCQGEIMNACLETQSDHWLGVCMAMTGRTLDECSDFAAKKAHLACFGVSK